MENSLWFCVYIGAYQEEFISYGITPEMALSNMSEIANENSSVIYNCCSFFKANRKNQIIPPIKIEFED